MNLEWEDIAVLFAIALAQRPHTSYTDTNPVAIKAAKNLVLEIEKQRLEDKD